MAEDPIKLFASRAERYPEPTEADAAMGAGRAVLAAIPFVGGSVTEVLSLVLAPAVARRRDTWFKELADGLEEAERKIDGFKIENLTEDETFISAVIEASRIAIGTHQYEKRILLRHALLNIAMGSGPGEEQQLMFLRYIDELGPTHITVLNFLSKVQGFVREKRNRDESISTYQDTIRQQHRNTYWQPDLVRQVLFDLHSRGLSTVREPDDSLIDMPGITGFGDEFLKFLSIPPVIGNKENG